MRRVELDNGLLFLEKQILNPVNLLPGRAPMPKRYAHMVPAFAHSTDHSQLFIAVLDDEKALYIALFLRYIKSVNPGIVLDPEFLQIGW
jgi:hypothetical protein